MFEIEQWIIQNNPHFLIEQLKTPGKSEPDLATRIEELKQAELELFNILQTNQAQSEPETI
jgi:hypothetical protein